MYVVAGVAESSHVKGQESEGAVFAVLLWGGVSRCGTHEFGAREWGWGSQLGFGAGAFGFKARHRVFLL